MCWACDHKAAVLLKENCIKDFDLYKEEDTFSLIHKGNEIVSWTGSPLSDPLLGMQDKEINKLDKNDIKWQSYLKYEKFVIKMKKKFVFDPLTGYSFVKSCKRGGYTKKDGNIVCWFFDLIGE